MFYLNEKLTTDREKLATYEVPTLAELQAHRKNAVGDRWVPVHHLEMIRMIEKVLTSRGYRIVSEAFQYGSSRKNPDGLNVHNLYGYFVVEGVLPGLNGIKRILAFRHSNVQDFAIKFLSGGSVDLCENGIANGEYVVNRKHTAGVNLFDLISLGIDAWEAQQKVLGNLIERLHAIRLTVQEACYVLMTAAADDIVSSDKLVPVYAEYLEPCHDEWRQPTGWCLLQAVTQKAKQWALSRQDAALHRMPVHIVKFADDRGFDSDPVQSFRDDLESD